jgi:hypothetical protein
MAAYHDSFWAVVGAAVPVVALANAVTLGRGLRIAHKIRSARDTKEIFQVSAACAKVFTWAALISILFCVVEMAGAARSLIDEADAGLPLAYQAGELIFFPFGIWPLGLVLSLALLLPQVAAEAYLASMWDTN